MEDSQHITRTAIIGDSNGSLTMLPTHIKETKKLVKQNGETVEIVTLTLASGPKIMQTSTSSQSHSGSTSSDRHSSNANINSVGTVTTSSKLTLPIPIVSAPRVSESESEPTNFQSASTSASESDKHNFKENSTTVGNDTMNKEDDETERSNFLIVNSSSSGFTTADSTGKLTFITTNSHSVGDTMTMNDSIHTLQGAGDPNSLPLVHMVDGSDLVVQSHTVVTGHENKNQHMGLLNGKV